MAKPKVDLVKAGYLVSDSVLASLARDYVNLRGQAEGVRGSFLRILVAHTLKELKDMKVDKPTKHDALVAIDSVHRHLYSVVLEAITTDDIKGGDGLSAEESSRRSRERNRRTTFARSAKSVLASWVRRGGKIETLVPAEVRKDELQFAFQSGAKKKRASLKDRVNRVERKLESLVKRMVDKDPKGAEQVIREMNRRLAALVAPTKSKSSRRPSAVAVSTH